MLFTVRILLFYYMEIGQLKFGLPIMNVNMYSKGKPVKHIHVRVHSRNSFTKKWMRVVIQLFVC